MQKKLAQREKEKHEANLRALAQKAREERAGESRAWCTPLLGLRAVVVA